MNGKPGSITIRFLNSLSRRRLTPAVPGRGAVREACVDIARLANQRELRHALERGSRVVLYCAKTTPFGGSKEQRKKLLRGSCLMREIEEAGNRVFTRMPPYLEAVHAFPSAAQAQTFGRARKIEISLKPKDRIKPAARRRRGQTVRWLNMEKLKPAAAEASSGAFSPRELKRLVEEYLASSGSHEGRSVILIDLELVEVREVKFSS